MKLVVPLTIPCTRSIGVAESDSSSRRTTGTAPATAASNRSLTSCSRAVSNSSSPCCESSCLLALTTSFPACIARSRYSRAGSMPPISSTSRSASARISSKLPRLRVRTPLITGRTPLKRSISAARSCRRSKNADPTVPKPSRPTLKRSPEPAPAARGLAAGGELVAEVLACDFASEDIAGGQVLEALTPHHNASVAVAAEDHRRPGQPVVVAGHRIPVGAGRRRHDHIARPGVVEQRFAHDHVARLAVLADQNVLAGAAEAVGHVRLIH